MVGCIDVDTGQQILCRPGPFSLELPVEIGIPVIHGTTSLSRSVTEQDGYLDLGTDVCPMDGAHDHTAFRLADGSLCLALIRSAMRLTAMMLTRSNAPISSDSY